MFRYGFTTILMVFVICSFCGGEFKSLGRHTWRCKERLRSDRNSNPALNIDESTSTPITTTLERSKDVSNCSEVKCCCGKLCNGLRGLKMHQRSCRVIKGLEQETFEHQDINQSYDDTGQFDDEIDFSTMPDIKPGVRLPTSDLDWKLANDFFVGELPIADVNNKPINVVVSQMNLIIYDYFYRNFGPVKNSNSSLFVTKYKDYSKSMLKSSLKALKAVNGDPCHALSSFVVSSAQ